jgi:SMI1 / KNR4 family (SUKH-1)
MLRKNKSRSSDIWEDRVAQLAQLLDELRLSDLDCRLFGARKHRYILAPTLGEARLSALEAVYDVRLPEDYRSFLRLVGNGGAGPHYGLFSLEEAVPKEDLSALATPFPYAAAHVPADDDRLPGCLTLAHHGCGYYDFLVVTGPDGDTYGLTAGIRTQA